MVTLVSLLILIRIRKKNVYKNNKSYKKPNYHENSYKKNYKKHYQAKNKPKDKPYLYKGKRKAKKLDITCHKCGKIGHYANKCWTKKALNEIEDEQLRSQLEKVLLMDDASESSENIENLELIEDTSSESSFSSSDNDDCQSV